MPDPSPSSPRRHVLLIGIDNYRSARPLHGCVNDIDAIEAILLDRLGVPASSIQKLAAPHATHLRAPRVPERPPTTENLRAALTALTGDAVAPGDRVLIYYAGHGTQILPDGERTAREALVPQDIYAGGELLYDHELNDLLARIARRTTDLTVILDCCCSAGATRSALLPPDSTVRFCPIDSTKQPPLPRPRSAHHTLETPAGLLSSLDPADPGYLVAAACQSHEQAFERKRDGQSHGAFTAALLDRLEHPPDADLAALRWADVWQSIRERVLTRYPAQHPWLIGRSERRLFGGDFQPQDPGIPISRAGARYTLAAGTLVGLGRSAKVAVYGPAPAIFPHLGSPEDLAARRGILEIEEATPSSATARPLDAESIDIEGARGRLIAAGDRDALVVALDPFDADLARWLSGQGPLRVVPANQPAGEEAIVEAYVGLQGGLRWIGDDVYGPSGEPPLVQVPAEDADALLRVLLHYERYNRALRLARRCLDLPGALRVRLLDCPASWAGDGHDPALPEVGTDPKGKVHYVATPGQRIAIHVENRSGEHLYTNILNCAVSGRVEILGPAQLEIPPGRRLTFWLGGHLGKPFGCGLPEARSSGVDRIIAVGTTRPDADLSSLKLTGSFEDALQPMRDFTCEEGDPDELWTATLVTLKLTRP